MITSTDNLKVQVQAKNVLFDRNMLHIILSDDREISLYPERVRWLDWLAKATPEQRARWTIEPGGFAIYWEELDNGIEVEHLLSLRPLA